MRKSNVLYQGVFQDYIKCPATRCRQHQRPPARRQEPSVCYSEGENGTVASSIHVCPGKYKRMCLNNTNVLPSPNSPSFGVQDCYQEINIRSNMEYGHDLSFLYWAILIMAIVKMMFDVSNKNKWWWDTDFLGMILLTLALYLEQPTIV